MADLLAIEPINYRDVPTISKRARSHAIDALPDMPWLELPEGNFSKVSMLLSSV